MGSLSLKLVEIIEGDRITARMIGSQNEEVTFTQPHYPHDVGQKVQVKVRKVDKNGRITAVAP